jgi:hypothetical protein
MQQISLIPDHRMGFSQISVDLSQNRGCGCQPASSQISTFACFFTHTAAYSCTYIPECRYPHPRIMNPLLGGACAHHAVMRRGSCRGGGAAFHQGLVTRTRHSALGEDLTCRVPPPHWRGHTVC